MLSWQSPDCQCSAQCERSISMSLLSFWANRSVSVVGRAQQSVFAGQHRLYTLCQERYASYRLCLIYLLSRCRSGLCSSLNLRCSLCVGAWRTHPPSLSKTRYCHNWPVHQVSCWKSRFCTDVRPVALCNHVHTQPGFIYTLEGKTEGLSGFYFKVPFQGKLAAQARIQILLVLRAKLLVWIIQMSTCWLFPWRTLHFYLPF